MWVIRQHTPTQCVRDGFLGEISLNALLYWLLDGSIQWLSTESAEEKPNYCTVSDSRVKLSPDCWTFRETS